MSCIQVVYQLLYDVGLYSCIMASCHLLSHDVLVHNIQVLVCDIMSRLMQLQQVVRYIPQSPLLELESSLLYRDSSRYLSTIYLSKTTV